jgi:prolyl-tRNA editing enzyme YbaK/EbsC (Cys-tRNA(Pro) deacylase)
LSCFGLALIVREFSATTRSSAEAASAIGCELAQIAKSMIFRTRETNRPVLVVASGANRVDEKAVGAIVGERIERADPEFVRANTGYAIGGVPPVSHVVPPLTVIDSDLLKFGEIWAAAGTPNAVFRLAPDDLVRITAGQVAAVAKR